MLKRLQEFDPPGVFARSLAECLALQLADRGRLDPPMQRLLERLDLLAEGKRDGAAAPLRRRRRKARCHDRRAPAVGSPPGPRLRACHRPDGDPRPHHRQRRRGRLGGGAQRRQPAPARHQRGLCRQGRHRRRDGCRGRRGARLSEGPAHGGAVAAAGPRPARRHAAPGRRRDRQAPGRLPRGRGGGAEAALPARDRPLPGAA